MRPILAIVACLFLVSPVQAQFKTPVRNVLKKYFGPNCQAQSAGFVVVGQIESDGAVVTSVGPVVDPALSMAPTLPSVEPFPQVLESTVEKSIAAGRDFRSALLKAARQERGQSLTVGEYFQIFVGSLNAAKLEQAKLAVADSAIQDGVLPADQAIGAIDWAKLIELIIKYLPMILDLFKGK
jgi:hypothetical protein